jgi:hypothetical protein
VALSEEEAKAEAHAHYGKDVALVRDPDVLDTWFSSALWPFSTLGWPEQTPELAKYYPTSVLVTGWDILFFWVARMMMMGSYFMKEVPFRTVYLHGLVTDEKGQKMSKSKGNVIDPLELIDKYGADALRFTMTSLAASQAGRLRLAPSRVEGSRNFATKLWNATRYAEMNGAALPKGFDPASAKLTVNKWMLGELARANTAIDKAMTDFRLNEASNTLYEFIWGIVCDWYVELTKPILQGADGPEKDETRAVTAYVLRETVKLLHPVMPFITEELWDKLGARGRRRDGMAGEADLRYPLGASRAERAGGGQAQDAGGGWRRHDREAAGDSSRRDREAGTHRGDRGGRGGAQGSAADRGGRGDLCAPGHRRDRPQGRGRAPAEGNQEAGRRGRQDRRQARQRRLRLARAGRGGRGAARTPQPGRADPLAPQHGAGAAGGLTPNPTASSTSSRRW